VKLLIVESPGKIKKLRSFLGQGWEVAASVGHICDLPPKELGISFDADKVRLALVVTSDRKETVSKLQAAAKKATEIFLATDPDREGEAIAYHVGLQLGKDHWSKIKRVAFNEISERAVVAAVQTPRRIDMALVNAQQARRVVDRLVGYRVSPLLWNQDGIGTSAGRVQSVAVRLVVEREREVRAFVPEEFWTIEAILMAKGSTESASSSSSFAAKLHAIDGKVVVSKIEDGKEGQQCRIASKAESDEIVAELSHALFVVSGRDEKPQTRKPPAPFVTSSLQQSAHGALKWDASKTMQIAQKLYEAGLITYMRTDSPSIAPEALTLARDYIVATFGERYLPNKPQVYVARDKRSQESHECIRPVQLSPSTAVLALTGDEAKLYEVIWKQFVACQMADALYDTGLLSITAGKCLFQVRGRHLRFDGWTRVLGELGDVSAVDKKNSGSAATETVVLLPPVKVGEELYCRSLKPSKASTKPPLRYSEARLIKTLEQRSIGRPSTYASILKTIKSRGYVVDKQRVLHATPVGEGLVDFLLSGFDASFMDYQFTARMEDTLDSIASGEAEWEKMAREFNGNLTDLLKSSKLSGSSCPRCGSLLRRRKGKNGDFLGCSGYPECRHTTNVPATFGQPMTSSN
jgi:DNA topoisomerase I